MSRSRSWVSSADTGASGCRHTAATSNRFSDRRASSSRVFSHRSRSITSTRTPSLVTVRYVSDELFSSDTSPGNGGISTRTFTSPGLSGALTVTFTSLSFSFASVTSSTHFNSSSKNTRTLTREPCSR